MKTLLKNGKVINVFTGEIENANVLIANDVILGVGDYDDSDADTVQDAAGKCICPGFIDGHIHIESTMLTPFELARACVLHGTTSIAADPHEIANVCGQKGIEFMLQASEGLPLTVYVMLPSCVPSTKFDESGAVLRADELMPFYSHPRVLGLGEMMNYPAVTAGDPEVLQKINDAHKLGKTVNGHAPLLSGKALDKYIAAGIYDDHECSGAEEAFERIRKGQWVMIRQGTAARDLKAMMPLFKEPWASRCLLVTDDLHPADMLKEGHIDRIIREAVRLGGSPVTGIRMATLNAAQCFSLKRLGAISPGYLADILLLSDLDSVTVTDVYRRGQRVVQNGRMTDFAAPAVEGDIIKTVRGSFHLDELSESDFVIKPKSNRCRVIKALPGQLITDEWQTEINFGKNNGVDVERDILKLAVIERHSNTGHIGLGFISGIGIKSGAIASSVSHDCHNLIVIGTNEADMALAANRIRELGGGCIAVSHGDILAEMPLPIAGLMTDASAVEAARQNQKVRKAVHALGAAENIEPFMNMAFLSLPVIPSLKMTTRGLVDVDLQQTVSLFI